MKYKTFKIIISLIVMLLIPVNVGAKEYNNYETIKHNGLVLTTDYTYDENKWNLCTNPNALKTFKFIGNILDVVFIAIPIILILMGSIDFMKAVMASKEDEIKKAQGVFIKRIVAAVVVFFVPIIASILLELVEYDKSNCFTCVVEPNTCVTQ